jgi:hypothetical protein
VPIFEYWPFECIMYPLAVMPYCGILYPNKTFLTLYSTKNMELIEFYGGTPPNTSVYDSWKTELKQRIRKKLWFLPQLNKPSEPVDWVSLERHFLAAEALKKPLSYVNYGPMITWYFGKEFYGRLCELAKNHLAGSEASDAPST